MAKYLQHATFVLYLDLCLDFSNRETGTTGEVAAIPAVCKSFLKNVTDFWFSIMSCSLPDTSILMSVVRTIFTEGQRMCPLSFKVWTFDNDNAMVSLKTRPIRLLRGGRTRLKTNVPFSFACMASSLLPSRGEAVLCRDAHRTETENVV